MAEVSKPRGLMRWGGVVAALLFAASAVAHVIDGSSVGSLMFSVAMAGFWGFVAWREWR